VFGNRGGARFMYTAPAHGDKSFVDSCSNSPPKGSKITSNLQTKIN
jgi:hypothetical protein